MLAERATRKGAASQFDHNCIVHAIWLVAAKVGLYVDRVASDSNIADLPSREEYEAVSNFHD